MTAAYEGPITVTVAETRGFWWGVGVFIQSLGSLALRFALALPFWNAGVTKWDGFLKLRDATIYQYQEMFRPTILGTTYSMPYPEVAAWVASTAEILLPAALVIGFATRLSALGLLIMTGVVYTTYQSLGVDPWQTETLPWGAMALALIGYGAGIFSFDYAIWRAWRGR